MTCLPCKSRRLGNSHQWIDPLSPWRERVNGTLQAQLRGTETSGNTGKFEGNFWCLPALPAIQLAAFLHTEGATPCNSCVRSVGEAPVTGTHPPISQRWSPGKPHCFLGLYCVCHSFQGGRECLVDEETTLPRISGEN